MKRFQNPLTGASEAKLVFQDGDYQILRHGTFVRCAVTGDPIQLDDLRYWSVERQEAYKTADISLQRVIELRK
ncbi:MAG: DUF2093 domain-containing protein [Hyphomicrobiaceae bacterium]|nr:DUF2093 domain-containing protein [Hyphomicrobiaceae bacterium]